jgi:hypothetical protein
MFRDLRTHLIEAKDGWAIRAPSVFSNFKRIWLI